MDVRVEELGSYLRKVFLVVPAADVDAAYAAATRAVSKQANLPGFRPGKVPKAMLERQFGPQIESEVQNKLVEATLFDGMDQAKVEAVAMPKVQVGTLRRGEDFSYTAEVEVRPPITLHKYEGLSIEMAKGDVASDAIDAALEEMRTEAAQTVPVTDRNEVQAGDIVLVDYAGSIDGVPFEGGKAEGALVETSSSQYIPGFAEGLIGGTVPGERDVEVTFPEDYGATHLAGKKAVFHMTLRELKTQEKPALDEEFAKDKGQESLAALREHVTQDLKAKQDKENEQATRQSVLKALVDANAFEVPPSMVDSQVERMVTGAAARLERMTGQKVSPDDPMLADLRGSSRDDAEFQVRAGLLLMEVGKKENIEVDAKEVEAEIEKLASQAGEHAKLMRSMYQEEGRKDELRFRLLEDKVVRLLIDRGQTQAS